MNKILIAVLAFASTQLIPQVGHAQTPPARVPSIHPVVYVPWETPTPTCSATTPWDSTKPRNLEFMELTFAENFDVMPDLADSTGLGNKWAPNYDTGFVEQYGRFDGYPYDVKRRQAAAHEQQLYVDDKFRGAELNPFSVYDSVLSITASRTPEDKYNLLWGYPIVSGLLSAHQLYAQAYGYYEMSAKVPAGKGLLPAFWMLPLDRSATSEIDIMEAPGHQPGQLSHTLHWASYAQASTCPKQSAPSFSNGFHTYGLLWRPDRIVFYYDGVPVSQMATPANMDKPFYMMANLAVGGDWQGFVTPSDTVAAQMDIDYIAAYTFRDSRKCTQTVNSHGVKVCQ
jgi:beta-glucanase (GH16 family)